MYTYFYSTYIRIKNNIPIPILISIDDDITNVISSIYGFYSLYFSKIILFYNVCLIFQKIQIIIQSIYLLFINLLFNHICGHDILHIFT